RNNVTEGARRPSRYVRVSSLVGVVSEPGRLGGPMRTGLGRPVGGGAGVSLQVGAGSRRAKIFPGATWGNARPGRGYSPRSYLREGPARESRRLRGRRRPPPRPIG